MFEIYKNYIKFNYLFLGYFVRVVIQVFRFNFSFKILESSFSI